ncbi:DUF882 domain-containing protein [Flammeovirga sp. MY04]|uniref:D-Ala-D-Ala carboxypeptidase family metallohydrolase n=1 Tax=Flammeovirga sp. MY04 TaxID=1191459 RepID=UPI00080616C3|nr:D-Ala-D-Ala carboxypeptidase family metallohydrolase [Flammeovirga sp. MY04]ANQ48099.1 DUF882 domain-containing protein [Flammeovirga sp. MY04]
MKYRKQLILITLLFSFVIGYKFLWVLDPILARGYDIITGQKAKNKVDINQFEWVSRGQLPLEIEEKLSSKTCKSIYYDKEFFFKISWFDRYKNIIGKVKAYQLLTPDRLIRKRIRIPNLDKTQYLLIDFHVLQAYQKLMDELQLNNYNTNEVYITSAFRNPAYNQIVGGASCSQHQKGNALDIHVGDINSDGIADQKDRKIIYDLLENKFIGSTGGIGQYANHPKLIHFDTRGYRARW